MKNLFDPANILHSLKEDTKCTLGREQAHVMGLDVWRTALKEGLRQSLGSDRLSLIRRAGKPELLFEKQQSSCLIRKYSFPLTNSFSMPLYTASPMDGEPSHPCILACHGHGPGADAMIGLEVDEDCHHNFGISLAHAGFLVVMPEFLGFGEASFEGEGSSCTSLSSWLLSLGHTMAGIRVWQARAACDWMMTLPEVNGPPGIYGFSGGGLVATFTAALDERFSLCALSGYAASFCSSIMDILHCLDNYIPGMLSMAEFSDLIGLICPRPLFIDSANRDEWFPLKSSEEAFREVEKWYEEAAVSDHLTRIVSEGDHAIYSDKMIPWLQHWMKPQKEGN